MKKTKAVYLIAMLIILLIACVPWLYSLVLSMKDYYAGADFNMCPWVGLANYTDFFMDESFFLVAKNELIIGITALVTGAVYVFLAIGALASIKNTRFRAIAAFVLVLAGAIPELAMTMMCGETLFSLSSIYGSMAQPIRIIVGALSGLRFSALFVVAGLFTRKNAISAAITYSLLFVAAGMISTLVINMQLVNIFSNDIIRINTFNQYLYSKYRIDGNYGYSFMIEIVYLIFMLVPAMVGTIIAALVYKKEDKPMTVRNLTPMGSVALIPVALFVFAIVVTAPGKWFVNATLLKAIFIGIGNALFSSAVIIALALVVTKMVGELKTGGIVLVCVWCLLAANMLGKRMFFINIGLQDSIVGLILNNLAFTPVVVLLLAMLAKENEGRLRAIIPASVVAGGMVFARFWCNFFEEYLYIYSKEKYSITRFLRSWYFSVEEYDVSELMYVLCPIIVVGICIAVAMYIGNKQSAEKDIITE